MRLLLIEDDAAIHTFLRRSLMENGFTVDVATRITEAEALAQDSSYEAFILDLELPDGDGLDLMSRMRERGTQAPFLILSARRSVSDRVSGLERGGDDYLTKPFALAELLVRLRKLIKRSGSMSTPSCLLSVLDVELNLLRREAWRAGDMLQLTRQEFTLLEYLCRNAGRVVTRTMILDEVWGMRIDPATNVVDVHMYRLRGKVDVAGSQPLIRTIRGVGYVLRDH